MTAIAAAHAPSRTSAERGRHGVAAITAPITTTVSSLLVSSRPAPGASVHSSETAFHAVQAASSASASVAGDGAKLPRGRATARVSSRPALSRPAGYQALAK